MGSVSVVKVNAETLFRSVDSKIEADNIPYTNMMSPLMDSCDVMHGSKNGVEKRLRDKAPHLLDIDWMT